jgi:hypothetical protein
VQDREAAREMQELSRELQRAVEEAVRKAMRILQDAGHGATTDTALQAAGTLRAVLAGDEATRAELEAGRLLAPVSPGFGFAAAAGVEPPAVEPRSTRAPGGSTGRAGQHLEEQRQRAARAAEAAEAAERELFQRKTEQRRADDAVADVRTRMQELQAELSRAEDAARAAADMVREAVEGARTARREADRLQSALPPA